MISKLPLVSIIIASYNHGKYIVEAIESLKKQTFSDWECIIIDDGSKDDTKEVVDIFVKDDSRFRYFYQENAGESKARNYGVSLSSADKIMFLDADDFLRDEHLEILYTKLINSSSDIVFCGTQVFIDWDTYYELKMEIFYDANEGLVNQERIYCDLFVGNFITIHSAMMRKEVFQKNAGFCDNNFFEDYDFWLKSCRNNFRFYYISKAIALYRVLNNKKNLEVDYIIQSKYAEIELLKRNYDERFISKNNLHLRIKKVYKRMIKDLIRNNFYENAKIIIREYKSFILTNLGDYIRISQYYLMIFYYKYIRKYRQT